MSGNSIVSASNGDIAITPNGTGDVIIDGLKHPQADGSAGQFLKTDGSGQLSFGTVNTDLSADSSPQLAADLDTNGNDISFGDNDKAIFNTDHEIYSTGNESFIDEIGTGSLSVRANNLFLTKYTGETYIQAVADGAVTLYHDNSQKLTTTSSGVDVTGALYATTNIGLDSTDYITFTNNTQMDVYLNGNNEFRFEADGDFHADGDVVAFSTTVSDERLKTDITKIDDAVDKVGQLNGYTFTYKADGKQSAGVIAQEVEKVLPSAVREKELPLKADDGVAYKTVQYDQLVGLLVEAVNELSARVKELENGAPN